MIAEFSPEVIFVESDILFIATKALDNLLSQSITENQKIISIDCKVLWELMFYENQKQKKLALHIDFPKITDITTINFNEEDSRWILSNPTFNTLGIIINYFIDSDNHKSIIFIPNINEGLQMINEE